MTVAKIKQACHRVPHTTYARIRIDHSTVNRKYKIKPWIDVTTAELVLKVAAVYEHDINAVISLTSNSDADEYFIPLAREVKEILSLVQVENLYPEALL